MINSSYNVILANSTEKTHENISSYDTEYEPVFDSNELNYKNENDIEQVEEKQEIILDIKDDSKTVLLGCSNEKIEYSFEGIEDERQLIWTSSDESIVQVIEGNVLANSEGKATVELSTEDGSVKDQITIEVVRNFESEELVTYSDSDTQEYTLIGGITYEITNNSSNYIYINTDDNYYNVQYDVILYDSDGQIDYLRIGDYGSISISSGDKIKLRLRDSSMIKVNITRGNVSIKSSSTPLLEEIKFE